MSLKNEKFRFPEKPDLIKKLNLKITIFTRLKIPNYLIETKITVVAILKIINIRESRIPRFPLKKMHIIGHWSLFSYLMPLLQDALYNVPSDKS